MHSIFQSLALSIFVPLLPGNALDPFPGDADFVGLRYSQALHIYDSVAVACPADPHVLWRMSRVCICMGDVESDDKREDLYRRAESYARRCIAADSMIAEGHTWLGAALGSIAMFEGGKRKVHLCVEIKRELDRAILLNPGDDVAYSILGSFYRALGNISWIERQFANLFLGKLPEGGFEDGEKALKQAIGLAPNIMRHQYELGMLYKNWERFQEAKAAFKRAAQLPILLASDIKTRSEAVRQAQELPTQ